MTAQQFISALRSKTGWSQERVASELGVNQATVSRIERGGFANKTVCKMLERLVKEAPEKVAP